MGFPPTPRQERPKGHQVPFALPVLMQDCLAGGIIDMSTRPLRYLGLAIEGWGEMKLLGQNDTHELPQEFNLQVQRCNEDPTITGDIGRGTRWLHRIPHSCSGCYGADTARPQRK